MDLKAGFVVVVGFDGGVVVVGSVTGVDAVRSVDEPGVVLVGWELANEIDGCVSILEIVKLPIVAFLDV